MTGLKNPAGYPLIFKCNPKCNVWFQKISIPPPRKIIENSEGEGGFKGSYCQGVGGVHGKLLFQRVMNHKQNIESNVQSIVSTKTYVHCFETKISTPGHWDEVNIISFNVSVFLCSYLALQSPEEWCVFGTKSKQFKMADMTGVLFPDFQLLLVFVRSTF